MRHCFNDAVDVYQSEGPNLQTLLRDAADTMDEVDSLCTWFNFTVSLGEENDYVLTLYVH